MSEDQVIVCEGCGSSWRASVVKGRAAVIARLMECPLCENKEAQKIARALNGKNKIEY